MKREYKSNGGVNPVGITPARLISAIEIAVKYASPDDMQIVKWLESQNMGKSLDEICDLVQSSVDEKTWKKIKI